MINLSRRRTLSPRLPFLYFVLLAAVAYPTQAFPLNSSTLRNIQRARLQRSRTTLWDRLHYDNSNPRSNVNGDASDRTRRTVWKHLLFTGSVLVTAPAISDAGEIGAQITKAVTTSDLGLSVRTSVVKGAQVMDQLDGKWEKFSDRFGLGSERSKQGSRPQPKVIPDPLPLSVTTAQSILEASDRVFCTVTGITTADLQTRVEKVANLVKVTFERAGIVLSGSSILQFESAPQFNFVVYSHFKAYSELIMDRSISFGSFRTDFEKQLGKELASLVLGKDSLSKSGDKRARLQVALESVDKFLSVWKQKGLVAFTERTAIDDDQISDWLDDSADLEFNIALDGDITLNSQVLLQEQGFRLYPNFCRYAITYLLDQVSPSDLKISAMDYYFDTDYSSDPDKFEVKEVLLSVQLENI